MKHDSTQEKDSGSIKQYRVEVESVAYDVKNAYMYIFIEGNVLLWKDSISDSLDCSPYKIIRTCTKPTKCLLV